jgi:hypothetical protein
MNETGNAALRLALFASGIGFGGNAKELCATLEKAVSTPAIPPFPSTSQPPPLPKLERTLPPTLALLLIALGGGTVIFFLLVVFGSRPPSPEPSPITIVTPTPALSPPPPSWCLNNTRTFRPPVLF